MKLNILEPRNLSDELKQDRDDISKNKKIFVAKRLITATHQQRQQQIVELHRLVLWKQSQRRNTSASLTVIKDRIFVLCKQMIQILIK